MCYLWWYSTLSPSFLFNEVPSALKQEASSRMSHKLAFCHYGSRYHKSSPTCTKQQLLRIPQLVQSQSPCRLRRSTPEPHEESSAWRGAGFVKPDDANMRWSIFCRFAQEVHTVVHGSENFLCKVRSAASSCAAWLRQLPGFLRHAPGASALT